MNTEALATSYFQTLSAESWQSQFTASIQNQAIQALEHGSLIYFPHLAFHLFPEEMPLLTTRFSTQKRKNISYQLLNDQLQGAYQASPQEQSLLRAMLARYANQAHQLLKNVFPHYQNALIWGRTSYRPVQVLNRITSYRKDDKRLHVDAFPSSPHQGKRILRVFCNINPHGEDRVWRLGEPFEAVATRFLPKIKKPFPGVATLLQLLRLTKGLRTAYDYYMLQLHDTMKGDEHYQKNARQIEMRFPPGSTWIVQSDQVSHAAMSGQFMLEQTFYLPVKAMQNPALSPLRVLESKLARPLV